MKTGLYETLERLAADMDRRRRVDDDDPDAQMEVCP